MSEHTTQCAFIQWCEWNEGKYPDLKLIYSIPNGAHLAGDSRQRAIKMAKMKAEGLKIGMPDTHLPVPCGGYNGLYIEFKDGKNKLSDSQEERIDMLERAGHCCAVCYTVDEAIRVTLEYLNPPHVMNYYP